MACNCPEGKPRKDYIVSYKTATNSPKTVTVRACCASAAEAAVRNSSESKKTDVHCTGVK